MDRNERPHIFPLPIPRWICAQACLLARRRGVSLKQFFMLAIGEKVVLQQRKPRRKGYRWPRTTQYALWRRNRPGTASATGQA